MGRHPVLVYVLKFPNTVWRPLLVYVLKFPKSWPIIGGTYGTCVASLHIDFKDVLKLHLNFQIFFQFSLKTVLIHCNPSKRRTGITVPKKTCNPYAGYSYQSHMDQKLQPFLLFQSEHLKRLVILHDYRHYSFEKWRNCRLAVYVMHVPFSYVTVG